MFDHEKLSFGLIANLAISTTLSNMNYMKNLISNFKYSFGMLFHRTDRYLIIAKLKNRMTHQFSKYTSSFVGDNNRNGIPNRNKEVSRIAELIIGNVFLALR